MKAALVFFGSAILLSAMACSNVDQPQEAEEEHIAPVVVAGQQPAVSLDSFQRTIVCTRPGRIEAAGALQNRLYIRRGKDSVTYSGVVYQTSADHQRQQAYRFYFKAASTYSYAYIRCSNYIQHGAAVRQLWSREAGYHLKFGQAGTGKG